MQQVVSELQRRGSIRANEVNVRNWSSYRTIKTEDKIDFRAIMRLIGMDDQAEEYWDTMVKIDSAHHMAGQHIRRLLISQVERSSAHELEKLGRLDFELPGMESVSLAAVRIKEIYSDIVKVHAATLGHPIIIRGDSWQG